MENQPFSDWQGKMVGRYQMIRLIGRGGMSEVWLATDTQLRRQVALKILPPVLASEETYLRDFAYEARAAASLEHPHILGVHDFGEQQVGQGEVVPYLVMPYMPEGTLRERMEAVRGPLPVQESLRYLRQAAQAIDYAHSRGIIHRDIKPANMLLREDWLLLTDFGIAKILTISTARGQTYAGSGTPAYMAPEQIIGQAVPASDRYSLGVVAYQLFTGREPFHGATPSETISLHLKGQLPPPRQLNPQIPPEVERLLLLALSRQPEARPPSCMVLVDALQQAWMRGVQAHPGDPDSTLLAPWSGRLASTPSSPSHAPLSGGLSAPSQPSVASPVLPRPLQGGMPVVPATNPPASLTTGVPPNSGQFSATQTAPSLGGSVLEQKVGRRGILIGGAVAAAAVVGGGIFAFEALHNQGLIGKPQGGGPAATPTPAPGPQRLIPGVPLLALTGHTDEVWVASWSPDGRYLMTASKDRSIMLWDLAAMLRNSSAPQTLATPMRKWTVANIPFNNLTDAVCWSPDGKKLIAGNDFTDKIYVLDAFGTSTTPTVYHNASANANNSNPAIYTAVAPGPLQNHFSVTNGSEIQVWNLAHTDQPEASYEASEDLGAMAWSRDGKTLVSLSSTLAGNFQFFLWQDTNRQIPQSWNLPQRNSGLSFFRLADTLAWSPVHPNLLLISDADVAYIWDIQQKKPVVMLGAQGQGVASTPVIGKLSWSPNGRYVAGSYDRLGDGEALQGLANPPIFVWDVQSLLQQLTPSSATTAQEPLLNFTSQNALQHTKSITAFSWSPDGRYIATASLDKTVIIWKVDGG
jgi:serine/threonine protein kinase/WD40 repeat protein